MAGTDEAARRLTDRYDREARPYRELWAPILRKAALRLVRELAGPRGVRVLDVGTGVGALLPDLRAAFPRAFVVGVDRSHGMIALAPKGTIRAVMDARRLALPTASVDRVLFTFILFHLDQPLAGLLEARRVLRDGGRVGTLTWANELESKATRVWDECLEKYGAGPPDPATVTRHDFVDTPKKMEGLLCDAGFASARSWTEKLSWGIDVDHLIRLRTNMGSSKPRFDNLDTVASKACVTEARRRMKELTPKDFVARGRVIYAVGCA